MTSDSGTFLGSFLSLERAVNVIFILVLGNRKQHLTMKVKVLVVLMVGGKKKSRTQFGKKGRNESLKTVSANK